MQFVAATVVQMWRDTAGNINSLGGQSGAAHVEDQEDEVRSHSDADMVYHGGRWVLGDGEALVVTVAPPADDFLYWGLTIANPWMESYDYRYTTTSLNNRRSVRSDDGTWRVAIAPAIPASATGSTPADARRATCSSVGCSPTCRRTRTASSFRSTASATWCPDGPAGSDLGRHSEPLLVPLDERAMGGQIEPGVLEAVVVGRAPACVARGDVGVETIPERV